MANSQEKKLSKEEYNQEPVYYCKRCLSLKIVALNDYTDYCDTCGSINIDKTSIHNWEELYMNKYNKKYIEDGKNL